MSAAGMLPLKVEIDKDSLPDEPRYHARANDRELIVVATSKDRADFAANACNNHDALVEALSMVRDADNDCRADGLPTIPAPARAKIDAALTAAGAA